MPCRSSGLTQEMTKTRVALVDRPADEGFLRVEVEDVELVDPGRADQQRPLQHRLGRRLVLDDLGDVAARDHLARRHGDVLADLEARIVGLPELQVALAGRDVFGQHAACRAPGSRRCEATVSRNSSGLVRMKLDGEIALVICLT